MSSHSFSARTRLAALLLAVLAVLGVSCADSGEADDVWGPGVRVVTTTTVLSDLAAAVVGADGTVLSLMSPGQDPHDFALSAQQAQLVREADVVFAIGLGLEASLEDALGAAEQDGALVVRLGESLEPRSFGDAEGSDELDPHIWLDPLRMGKAATLMAATVAEVAGTPSDFAQRAQEVEEELSLVSTLITAELAEVPVECRLLVTDHDSLGYFADAYGFTVVGTVIPGTSTAAEPSAKGFAELAELLRDSRVPAIFVEETQPVGLAETLAGEIGRPIEIVRLYAASIGPAGSGAETYVGMLRTNARVIAEALSSC